MKKIGIVTMIGNENYGNRLQNYATHFILKKYGNKPITIINNIRLNNYYSFFTMLKKRISYLIHIFLIKRDGLEKERIKKFKKFNKNIDFTKICHSVNTVKYLKCDYYIVGSDQVWKPTYGRLSDMDLLKFAKDKRRISFSASFGIDNLPEEFKDRVKRELLKFKSISVREEAGKNIIKKVDNKIKVDVLIDPTMMLTAKEWDKLIIKPDLFDKLNGKKYILNYFLGNLSNSRKKEIERIAKEYDCKIINLLDRGDPFYTCGPSEFLFLEKNAFLICTDSFHSSVFAILFDRPFVVFDREQKGMDNMNSRIDTLIEKFKLKNRRYNGKRITKENLIHDYSDSFKILEQERKKTEVFLKKALEIKK
ncbi:MAG: polysaccharide pyruvyl transferase family protein [Bacilli bacterium]|nr:polysaccharide pyruvyl transferase family protein [Bacilli bacterium]